MSISKNIAVFIIALVWLLSPAAAFASSLSAGQVNAIVALLRAFNVEASVIAQVEIALGVSASSETSLNNPTVAQSVPSRMYSPPKGSIYPSGSVGYDISYSTRSYPINPFGFAVIGVSGGRAFTDNARLSSEYLWARSASRAAPTLYMNLNAPYGKSAINENLSTPQKCDKLFSSESSSAEPAYPEPTSCASYNYGYNAAKHAFAYAKDAGISSPIWWLDIEEANSWSLDQSVNDAAIQGAIDYLSGRGARTGIYSTTRMWKEIAGNGFSPKEKINGEDMLVPNWFPIGISNRTAAINACHTAPGFTDNSVMWIIQYVENSTAVDQNVAC